MPVRLSRSGLSPVPLLVVCLTACECGAETPDTPNKEEVAQGASVPAATNRFLPVLPDDDRFLANPSLLERLTASPHGYFRFINRPYAQAVCELLRDRVRSMPNVNLHGDAHLEQFAVTDAGAGLTDFDDSSFGPGALDLVRFGGSLKLAAEQQGLPEAFEPAFDAFLEGYRAALEDPDVERESLRFAVEARANFQSDRRKFLEWATGLVAPMSAPAAFQNGYGRYRALMESEHPDLGAEFFEVVQSGQFKLGVGSALDEKYLIRVQGPSAAPDDDIILEYKEVRDLSGIDCIDGAEGGGAFRILISQTRIGQMPHRFLAQVPRERGDPPGAQMYWVHEWAANYKELTVDSVTTAEDLAAIGRNVGIQLGKGHPRAIASPLDSQLRRAQRQLVDELGDDLREAVLSLTAQTREAWERFRHLAQENSGPAD